MSVQVSYKKQTLLGIIGLLILFLAVEAIANVWWTMQMNCEFEENEIFMNMDENQKRQLCVDLYEVKTLGNELIPNQQSNSITINNLGFRGEEFSLEKLEGVYRIVMLGGSTMFGHGATSDQTTIPGYVQELFQNYNNEYQIEIINGGVQGADSNYEVKIIENKIMNYSPDMVIVYDGWNDLRAETTIESLHDNWKMMCELGQQNNFDVIIALQPIAGFGNKILTKQETEYSTLGVNYNDDLLINSLPQYQKYASNLNYLENCTSSIDLRNIFDNELSPIYWDQGHVSDKGNNIVANALYNEILEFLPKDIITKVQTKYVSGIITENKFENQIRFLLSNYKTSVMIGSIFSFELPNENLISDINETVDDTSVDNIKERVFETQLKKYESEDISVSIEIINSPNNDKQKTLKIKTINHNDEDFISNVTYFLKILKDDNLIFSDFIFVEDDILYLDVVTNNYNSIEISGERQYDHNAIIATTSPVVKLSGPLLLPNEDYEFIFELRTLYDKSNWTFSLDDLRVKIQS